MSDYFKITIERVQDVDSMQQHWQTLEVRPLTQDEYSNVYAFERQREKDEVLTKEIRGYAPAIRTTKTETTKVYEQIVNAVDFHLPSVICAVNQLTEKP